MNDLLTAMVMITPVTMGLTQMAKQAIGKAIDVDRFAPVIAVVLGIGASFLFPPEMATVNEIGAGILSGLAASGLYSGTKATVMGK